jgi:hypothetical protein
MEIGLAYKVKREKVSWLVIIEQKRKEILEFIKIEV